MELIIILVLLLICIKSIIDKITENELKKPISNTPEPISHTLNPIHVTGSIKSTINRNGIPKLSILQSEYYIVYAGHPIMTNDKFAHIEYSVSILSLVLGYREPVTRIDEWLLYVCDNDKLATKGYHVWDTANCSI
jgi:hypothetical protein